MSQTRIRILHLEDSPSDAELQDEYLRTEGYDVVSTRVDTRDELVKALENGDFDLILADNRMPGFDGLSALKVVREKAPHIPFIFISGTLGEEIAIESLKNGATDYVIKHRLERLSPVVRRALNEAEEHRERQRAEDGLRLSNEILQRVKALVLVADGQGKIVYVSPSVKDILGYEQAEMLGDGWWKLSRSHAEDGEKEKEYVSRAASGEIPISYDPYERVVVTKDGQIRTIAWQDAKGPHGLLIGVGHDVSERKLAEEELQRLNASLEQRVAARTAELKRALKVKDEFLANVSHELRTPLNSIIGLSESLSDEVAGSLNEKQKNYINTISESGRHLLELINEVLDLAKIEAGQVKLNRTSVDIRAVAQSSLRLINQLSQEKGQIVQLDVDGQLDFIYADERRLKQMLVNLLSNAVKFTPQGGTIGLEVRGSQEENILNFTVWDTGIGITVEDLGNLFKPFVQLDSDLDRNASGTGLGLALVMQMARLHGGSVSVESEPGNGSRFSIMLPWESGFETDTTSRRKLAGGFPRAKPSGENERLRILLVEDTETTILMLKDYLEYVGFSVEVAKSGAEGIVMAKRLRPDLILMDVQIPDMDGLEVTRTLRNDAEVRQIPIIAITALAMHGDRERCLAAGMDEYLSKPINLRALVKMIQSFLKREHEP